MSRSICFVGDQPAWYGNRSGYYAQLPRAVAERGHDVRTITPCRGTAYRLAGKTWSLLFGLPKRRQSVTVDEVRFHSRWLPRPRTIGVILSIEEHLPALAYWRRSPARLIGTIHFPRAQWTADQAAWLRRLRSAVVLSRADIEFFASLVGADRVRFAYHGVDVEFFTPDGRSQEAIERPLLLCVGQFGRDFRQLARVAPVILEKVRDAELTIVLAPHVRANDLLPGLMAHPRVKVLSGLTDEALRDLYRRARLLLLPMVFASASNAVVEALACGLPIVSTDVGGMRDYGGGAAFPVVPRHDDAAFIDHAVSLAGNEGALRTASADMRAFAVKHLPWAQVADDHLRLYHELAG